MTDSSDAVECPAFPGRLKAEFSENMAYDKRSPSKKFVLLMPFCLSLAALCFSATHVDLAAVLAGDWHVNFTVFPNASPSSESDNFSIIFIPDATKPSVLHGTLIPPFNALESIVITFVGRGVFVANDGASDDRLGEFEFFATLMPHLTAVGQWRANAVFSANFISETSLHLTIAENNATTFFVFSKESQKLQRTFWEKHMLLILAGVIFLFRFVKSELRTRAKQLKQKAESEAETARFEREQATGGE